MVLLQFFAIRNVIEIIANGKSGAFYAVQTLLSLFESHRGDGGGIPAGTIKVVLICLV